MNRADVFVDYNGYADQVVRYIALESHRNSSMINLVAKHLLEKSRLIGENLALAPFFAQAAVPIMEFLPNKQPTHSQIRNSKRLDAQLKKNKTMRVPGYKNCCRKQSLNCQSKQNVHQTRPSCQKTLQTETVSSGHMCSLPRFRRRHEYRYNLDRWATVSAFCHAIEQMCEINNRTVHTKIPKANTIFHAAVVPDISLAEYVKRIAWFYSCSKECFVLALEYIHRITKDKQFAVNYNTAHHLILTSIKVASKFFDDKVFQNILYAKVVGLPATTISALEVHLLFLLSFNLYVGPQEYLGRYKKMLRSNRGQNKVTIR